VDRTAGHILIIDDDAALGAAAVRALTQLGGFDATHVTDSGAGIQQVKSDTWDLVITDIELPGMSGLQFLEVMHRLQPSLPVAVLTGHPSFDRAVEALRGSAADFMQKPIGPRELVSRVRDLVRQGRAAQAGQQQASAGQQRPL
jgi:DNA-binding NtrC family response regulator